MTTIQSVQEDADYRRGVHHGVANALKILCEAREKGSNIGDMIEAVGRLEDQVRKWRETGNGDDPAPF